MKKTVKITLIAIASVLLVLGVTIGIFAHVLFGVYETNDPRNYLKIVGNYSNEEPQEFVSSFFPAAIEESFSDVEYHYKAIRGDTYAYEAYLEFVIEDKDKYNSLILSIVDKQASNVFPYDSSFCEHTIAHEYEIWKSSSSNKSTNDLYVLERAKVGKILFSDAEQRLIFVAIGMFDGGGARTKELGYFLERFNIEPKDLATDIL